MTSNGHDHPANYTGMLIGGCTAAAAGGIGLPILLTVGIVAKVVLPTGFAALVMGLITVGATILVGRACLRKLDELRLDQLQMSTALFDESRAIRGELKEITEGMLGLARAMQQMQDRMLRFGDQIDKGDADRSSLQRAVERLTAKHEEMSTAVVEYAKRHDRLLTALRAEFEGKIARLQQQQTSRRRPRKSTGSGESGENVVKLPSQETLRAARKLAARVVRNQTKRAEDRTEDN